MNRICRSPIPLNYDGINYANRFDDKPAGASLGFAVAECHVVKADNHRGILSRISAQFLKPDVNNVLIGAQLHFPRTLRSEIF